MKLVLECLKPSSLKEKMEQNESAIWDRLISFNESEYIKIEAPSGTGKTTLTHFLYKIRTDYSGSIKYNDLDLKSYSSTNLAKFRQNHLSIVFQDLRLFPELTARENIEIKRLLTPNFSSKDLVDEMANLLKISKILDQKIRFCSFGEQQRIAIIRALMQPFDWLILDEPFSHLDQKNIRLASDLIDAVCKKRKASMIIMGLNKDNHFYYNKELVL